MPKPSVIVVNSLVSRGSVGGRAGVFALERLGYPVVFLPTLVLPWHLGHGRASRLAPAAAEFAALVSDLAHAPWLGEVGAVMTGYFADAEQVAAAAGLVAALKRRVPGALYLCDPIIGDGGRLFLPEEIATAIRDRLLPLADIATPNRFELDWLSRRSAVDNADLVAMARTLGPPEVAVTSAFADEGRIASLSVTAQEAVLAGHEALPSVPHGTGDLFAALYLAHRLHGARAAEALAQSAGAVLDLVRLAARLGTDEMPLAAGQGAFTAAPRDVSLSRPV